MTRPTDPARGASSTPGAAAPDATAPAGDPEATSFEEALAELESIVGGLERGELTLDESVRAFERGTGLLRVLTARLDDAERRVRELVEDPDGITEKPIDGGTGT